MVAPLPLWHSTLPLSGLEESSPASVLDKSAIGLDASRPYSGPLDLLCIVGEILQGCAQNIGMFVAARTIIGFACGFANVGASTYLAEIVGTQWRAFVFRFYWSGWFLGALIATAITYSTKNIQTYQDRPEDALKVLAVAHAWGDRTNQVVFTEYREITETPNFEKINGSVSPLEVICTPGNHKRILLCLSVAIFSMTMGNNVATYFLGTMLTTTGVTDINTQLQVLKTREQYRHGLFCARENMEI